MGNRDEMGGGGDEKRNIKILYAWYINGCFYRSNCH